MLEVNEGLSLVLEAAAERGTVISKKIDDTYNYVLAENIESDSHYPPYTRSKMDGFALRSEDLTKATPDNPLTLKVIATLAAGGKPDFKISPGLTAKIMTGAPIPEGADAVVPFEKASWQGKYASFKHEVKYQDNLSLEGEEREKGQVLLREGSTINSGESVLLALSGKEQVKVYSRPRVGIMVTGDEIISAGEKPGLGKIRNTNSYMLASQVISSGGKPYFLGLARDSENEIISKIKENIDKVDVITTTGGASEGEYDLIEEVFLSLGAEVLFRRVAVKPGKHTVTAFKEGKLLFGLSGSPAGAFVAFELFVRPLIRKMQGSKKYLENHAEARLTEYIEGRFSEDRYFKAHTCVEEGLLLTESKGQGLPSFAGVNSLIYIPRGAGPFNPGDKVNILFTKSK